MCEAPKPQPDRLSGMTKVAIAAYIIIPLLVLMVSALIIALVVQKEKSLPTTPHPPYSRVVKENLCVYS